MLEEHFNLTDVKIFTKYRVTFHTTSRKKYVYTVERMQ